MRIDGRNNDEIRPVRITRDFIKYPMGSVLIETGNTKVICTASVEDTVPPFLEGSDRGWITAEYNMLPGATATRKRRDISKLKLDGRSGEIQRLIGRSLRSAVDLKKMPGISIIIDCDVIQADGGTRTASINGGFCALKIALEKLVETEVLSENPIVSRVGAISAGIVNGEAMLDLAYSEDSTAKVDMNLVMNDKGEFIEIQGTGEQEPFSEEELTEILKLGRKGINEIFSARGDL